MTRVTPPRISLFCTLKQAADEVTGRNVQSLFRPANTNSRQYREDVTRDLLGMHAGLPRCYIRLFEGGYGHELAGFLHEHTDKRRVVDALFRAWQQRNAEHIRLVSAAFPAAFSGDAPRTRDASDGLHLARCQRRPAPGRHLEATSICVAVDADAGSGTEPAAAVVHSAVVHSALADTSGNSGGSSLKCSI